MEWIWLKSLPEQTEKWEQTETEESDMEKKTDEMTDAMERVNDSLDASGSQTEGEDVEEGQVCQMRRIHFVLCKR